MSMNSSWVEKARQHQDIPDSQSNVFISDSFSHLLPYQTCTYLVIFYYRLVVINWNMVSSKDPKRRIHGIIVSQRSFTHPPKRCYSLNRISKFHNWNLSSVTVLGNKALMVIKDKWSWRWGPNVTVPWSYKRKQRQKGHVRHDR